MAITNDQIDALPDRSPSRLLKLVEHQITQILATGQAQGMNGDTLTRADLDKLTRFRKELMAEVEAESASEDGGTIAIAIINRPGAR